MKPKPLLVGTRVRALYDVNWPGRGLVAHTGAIATIAGVTIDSQFGMYPVRLKDGDIFPFFIAPISDKKIAAFEVIE